MVCTYGHVVLHAVDDLEFLEGDLVDLVEDVERRDVDAVALDHIHEVVHCVISPHLNVAVMDPVLPTHLQRTHLPRTVLFSVFSWPESGYLLRVL